MAELSLNEQIMARVQQLTEEQKRRVLDFMEHEFNETRHVPPLPLDEWLKETDALVEELRRKYGDNHFDVVAALNEIREEASWLRS